MDFFIFNNIFESSRQAQKSKYEAPLFQQKIEFQGGINIKMYIIFAINLLLIPSLALAVPDSMVMGPYKVSFDSGFEKSDYNISIKDPIFDETLSGVKRTIYSMEIINKKLSFPRASISIVALENATQQGISGSDIKENLISLDSGPHVSNLRSSERILDGSNGAIVSGLLNIDINGTTILTDFYHAMYPLKFDSRSMVEIVSLYPWDEGTLNLLKTIHIEKL